MRKRSKLILGVGTNDAPFPTGNSPSFLSWYRVLQRCCRAKSPPHRECTMAAEWHRFMAFHEWYEARKSTQYEIRGNVMVIERRELRCELLVPGNRHYSPDLCSLVPMGLSRFLSCRHSGIKTLRNLVLANPLRRGRREYVGTFGDVASANAAWRARKHQIACEWADRIEPADPRLAAAMRERFAQPLGGTP